MLQKLKQYYDSRRYSAEAFQEAASIIENLERSCQSDPRQVKIEQLDRFIAERTALRQMTLDGLLGLARFFHLEEKKDIYIYLLRYLGGAGVLENIEKRLRQQVGDELADTIFSIDSLPPVGTNQKELPNYIDKLMNKLSDALTQDQIEMVLAGNNHEIPDQPFLSERAVLKRIGNLDKYLKDYHLRQVQNLQHYADTGEVWFEQKITQAVVDFVAANQEIQSAVRLGDKLYVTKIPYDPDAYLKADDPVLKAYYACHCPFARESILSGKGTVDKNWCYCSAGFVKHPYEVLFDRKLRAKLLDSALDGKSFCRFEIDIAGLFE